MFSKNNYSHKLHFAVTYMILVYNTFKASNTESSFFDNECLK